MKSLLFAIIAPLFIISSDQQSEIIQPSKWWEVHPRPIYAELQKVGTFQEWFDVYKLTEGTYAIYEPNQFEEAISYLVLGSERCVLIDAGTGIGNIKEVVKKLTDLPVSSVLTHEHYDHVAGAYRFNEIAAFDNAAALKRLEAGRDNDSLQGYISKDYLWKPLPKGFDPTTWTIPPIKPSQLLNDGDVVELGDRALEVIYTPGHSPGSMCLLDKTHRILFTGDHFYPGPLYVYPEDVNIEDYIASNKEISKRLSEYDHVCAGHNDPWVKSEVIPRVNEAFETVFAGKGEFTEGDGLRRYQFDGFGIIIRSDMVKR